MIPDKIFNNIFKNKKIFVTGHTGFIGSWLSLWLKLLGSDVTGYSLESPTKPSLFEILSLEHEINHIHGDLRDSKKITDEIENFKPDIVFHLAAQALVRESYSNPLDTLNTNIIGTANVFDAIRNCKNVKVAINMTSDKCYDNRFGNKPRTENDPMGGHDPYSVSKGASELITASYRNSFFNSKNECKIATARCGNVIGGGDWSNDRIIPDSIRALSNDEDIIIRNPTATRPWQHVLESISGIMWLATKMLKEEGFDEAWNFGPNYDSNSVTVEQLVKRIIRIWGSNRSLKIQTSPTQLYESKLLILDSTKSNKQLGWGNTLSLDETLSETINWYKMYNDKNNDSKEYTINQIKKYVTLARQRNLIWAK
ncbi:CDP-glucose 4,6-dehydratase [Candidatus Nitrosopelagicus sp.]|nr:CDP-glucose 4,6-dehydratase [Candidatus Nitrosopelagicus sp.]